MNKLYYCLDCQRVFKSEVSCDFCQSTKIKELVRNAPINILGTKLKGKVFKIEQEMVKVKYNDEHKKVFIKDFEINKIKKIL